MEAAQRELLIAGFPGAGVRWPGGAMRLFSGLALILLAGCAAVPVRTEAGMVTNSTGEDQLTGLAARALAGSLAARGISVAPASGGRVVELYSNIDETSGGDLQLRIVCASWPGRDILGEVRVRGSGGDKSTLIVALARKAAGELGISCR